jgi:hypothetical protein
VTLAIKEFVMIVRNHLCLVTLCCLALSTAWAVAADGSSFSHKDWDLVCDNTLTCRAAGYSPEGTEQAASVLLMRKAGPGTPLDNRVRLAESEDGQSADDAPQLMVANQSFGMLQPADDGAWLMNGRQLDAFMAALHSGSAIGFRDARGTYPLSGAGSSAVLLKMDDLQGRVGTRGALIRPGTRDESGVRQPNSAAVVAKAPVVDKESRAMTTAEIAQIKPKLISRIEASGDCDDEWMGEHWYFARLDDRYGLAGASCWRGAYNSGDIWFVIDNESHEPVQLVTTGATSYQQGTLDLYQKGRGLGDCMRFASWTWNGQRFVASSDGDTGRCMMIRPGGAWMLPTLVTRQVQR